MKGQRLYKFEKLCSRSAVESVFAGGQSEKSYPLRAVFRTGDREAGGTPARFLITIPKRKIRAAVDRALMRRRVREAYRLNRQYLLPSLRRCGKSVDIAFVYLDTRLTGYDIIESKMRSLLAKVAAAAEAQEEPRPRTGPKAAPQ